jgi:hypothetical protein
LNVDKARQREAGEPVLKTGALKTRLELKRRQVIVVLLSGLE